MAHLTEAKLQEMIQSWKPGDTSLVIAVGDGSGLSFCISKAGTASWKLRYRFAGKARWLSLGRYPQINLKEAEKRARKARVKLDDGVDPIAEKRRAKVALRAARTFAEVVDDFKEKRKSGYKAASLEQMENYLKKDLLPCLGRFRIDEVSSVEVVDLVEKVGKRSVHAAHRVFDMLCLLFKFAVAKHLCKLNPCTGLSASAIIGMKPQVRTPVSLNEAKLRQLFQRLPSIGRTNELAIKIILATAVRKLELVAARWENVHLDRTLWVLPAQMTKNGKEFVIPLPARVVSWFRELQVMACGSPFVLPGRFSEDKTMSASTLNGAIERLGEGLRHFTVHDLRRTARSHLGALGIDIIVAEKILNHTLGGLVEVYDRGDYINERRRALELWTELLGACEEGRTWKVTPLRQVA